MPSENIVILYDRGTIDIKAYCGKKEFIEILNALSISEAYLRDSYDAVFHLKTAADGAEKFYTLGNNKARSESPEKAREIDLKTIYAWTGHSHLRVVDNSTGFDKKINRLMVEIYAFLGLPVPLEIERKFLIKMPDIEQLTRRYNAVKTDILQTYLITKDKDKEKRIRRRGTDGDCSYFLTEKRTINQLSRVETEKKITAKGYLELLVTADTSLNQIRKERYCFVYNNLYFELDVYPFWSDYAILEIELNSENQKVDFPPFVSITKEVTGDPSFKEHSLSKRIPI
jgi:CYTH domain-containing protein